MVTFREAQTSDADALAQLINTAGEGLPLYLWRQAAPDVDPFVTGAQRAARETGGFSYRHALIAEADGETAGMLLDYRLDDPYPDIDPIELPEIIRPLAALEAAAPGSWYVNALAVFEPFRSRGIGAALLAEAETRGAAAGADKASIIVAEPNGPAMRLYERTGYREIARAPIAAYPGCPHTGDWLMLVKPIGQG